MKHHPLFILGLLLCPGSVYAQLQIDNTTTPAYLVQDVLLGAGVSVTNITYNGGAANQLGVQTALFTGGAESLGILEGIMLSTGLTTSAVGPSGAPNASSNLLGPANTDLDLMQLAGGTTINDAAVIEFDFVPSGNTISFRFVFASEEYPRYVCSPFNDSFGFFLSGPGINGPFTNGARNLAVVPGTNVPVTINSVNSGLVGDGIGTDVANCMAIDPNWTQNSIHYVDNSDALDPDGLEYNGSTVILSARANVLCGQTYHIKIAIGDAQDSGVDSAIFLEAGTFSSPAMQIDVVSAAPSIPCLGSTQLSASFQTTGVAPYSYDWSSGGVQLGLAPSLEVTVNAPMYYLLHVTDACGAMTSDSLLVLPIPPSVHMPDDAVVPCDFSGAFGAVLSDLGPGQYTMEWAAVDSVISDQQMVFPVVGPEPLFQIFTIEDECGHMVVDSFLVSIESHAPMDVIVSPDLTVFCAGDEATLSVVQVTGGNGPFTYEWTDAQGTVLSADSILLIQVTSDRILSMIATDRCGLQATATVEVGLPVHPPLSVAIVGDQVICENATTRLEAMVSGGSGMHQYYWPGLEESSSMVQVSPDEPTTYEVLVVDVCGYEADAQSTVNIERPVVDILAVNVDGDDWRLEALASPVPVAYDWDLGDGTWSSDATPRHAYRDLSDHMVELMVTTANGCTATDTMRLAPMAHLYFPNAFTPDGDGINDRFGAVGHQLDLVEFTVFDRWGGQVFESRTIESTWDGRMPNGEMAPTGVYVLKYRVAGERLPMTAGLAHVTLL